MPIVRELTFIDCENLLSQEFPPTVDSLRIERWHGQLGLFEASMQVEYCLQYLYISDCSSSISIGCLPTTLRTLEINNCDKLEFPFPHSHKFLERICIKNSCDFLISFPLNSFPKLNMLSIHGCRTLESLYVLDGLCQDLTSLSYLYILVCPNFASFPKGGLSATNLTKLKIGQCDKLKFLPEKMHTLFPSLQYLDISDCPDVELFPEASFPLSLQQLDIANCNKLIASRMSWNLRRLSVLENFTIGAESADLKSFPEEGLLSTAITSLTISGISCLKILDMKGMQELTSLKELWLGDVRVVVSKPLQAFYCRSTSGQELH
ncbi:LRR domain containing protein [Parasponia andersonii]|uniref:LRR domain containing protein n=1 Tax=Parasponia andersonii TaxID=3476 RepID=A0A2P5ACZ7_PARAD|nr:LRR domain containing protein [Parasponia andersonii]